MKVYRNQDVRPMLVALTAKTFDGNVREEYQHSGGIPLRLELAARFMAARIARERLDSEIEKSAPSDALKRADNLIAAHNATCGETENV